MAIDDPKSLIEKLSDYTQVTFATWLQKTNSVAREEGDLNKLNPTILSAIRQTITGCSHPVVSGQLVTDTIVLPEAGLLEEHMEIVALNQKRVVVEVINPTTVRLDAPLSPPLGGTNTSILNLSNINLVSAINLGSNETRRTLIKAIAMS